MGISCGKQSSDEGNSLRDSKFKDSVHYSIIDAEIGSAAEDIEEVFGDSSFTYEEDDEAKELLAKKKLINSFIENKIDDFTNSFNELKNEKIFRESQTITENNIREILLKFLFSSPLEKEIFEILVTQNIININDESEFVSLFEMAVNNEEYCNVHHLIFSTVSSDLINNIGTRKGFADKFLCKIFKTPNTKVLDPLKVFDSEHVSRDFKENVLKYVLHFRRIALRKHKDFEHELAICPSKFFQLFVPIMMKKEDKNLIKKFSSYINIKKTKYSCAQSKAILTADLNILAQEALYKDMKKALERIIKCSLIDINELTRVHKSQTPVKLSFYIAERGYVDLLKLFIVRKDFNITGTDGKNCDPTSLFSYCVRGRGYCKYVKVNKLFTVDYDKCIDMILDHPDFANVVKTQNVMAEAIRYLYDYAAMELIYKFGLTNQFIEECNGKILSKFLNKRIEETKCGIRVDYDFLKKSERECTTISNQALHNLKRTEMSKLIKHPVFASYIELKNDRFKNLHTINFVMFSILFVGCLITGFVARSNNHDKMFTIALFSLAVIYLTLREAMQFFFNVKSTKRLQKVSGTSLLIESVYYHYESSSNIAELMLIVSTYLSLLMVIIGNDWHFRLFFSITILLTTLELSLLLSAAFPSTLAIYFFMLKKVSISFARVVIFFFLIILAFAFAFHVVFYVAEQPPERPFGAFEYCWTSIVKTTTMLTGEYEAGDLQFNGWWSETLLLFFVLTAIVLFNLINGLAITDIQVLREDADFLNLINKLDSLDIYENLLDDYFKQTPRPDERWLRFVNFVLKKIIQEPFDSTSKVLYSLNTRNKCCIEPYIRVNKIRWYELLKIVKMNAVKSQKQYSEIKMEQIHNNVDNLNIQFETKLNSLSNEVLTMKSSMDSNNDEIRKIKNQLDDIKKLLIEIKKKKHM